MPLYLADELSEAGRAACEAHRAECAACAASLAQASTYLTSVTEALETTRLDDSFDAKVMQRLKRSTAAGAAAVTRWHETRAASRRNRLLRVVGVAAAVFLAVLLTRPLFSQDAGRLLSGSVVRISGGAESQLTEGQSFKTGDVLATTSRGGALVALSEELKVAMQSRTRITVYDSAGHIGLEEGNLFGRFLNAGKAKITTPAGDVEADTALVSLSIVWKGATPSVTSTAGKGFSLFSKAYAAAADKGQFIVSLSVFEGTARFYGTEVTRGTVALFSSEKARFEVFSAAAFEAELTRRIATNELAAVTVGEKIRQQAHTSDEKLLGQHLKNAALIQNELNALTTLQRSFKMLRESEGGVKKKFKALEQ